MPPKKQPEKGSKGNANTANKNVGKSAGDTKLVKG